MSQRIVDVAILKIPASRLLKPYEAAAIRGYLGRMFPEEPLLHHHLDNKFLYSYPKIQFKIIEGNAHIVSIDEGVSRVNDIKGEMNNLRLEENKIEFYEPELRIKKEQLGSTERECKYIFATLWLALNEKNYSEYASSNRKGDILKRNLIGNVLSMCKGLNYVVKNNLKVDLDIKEIPASLKGTPMLGFLGTFSVNFEIPDYWGIGKSVSRGFGTVKRS